MVSHLAFDVAFEFLGSMLRTAVIREEDGKYCVRSPHNKDWNGGCFDSKGEAEKRLQQVEYFKRQSSKTVWIVRDWDNRTEYIRDVCWPEEAVNIPKVIMGTGLDRWERENTSIFTDEVTAMRNLERRLKVVDKRLLKSGLYRHMHGDGRIIYVSIPDKGT